MRSAIVAALFLAVPVLAADDKPIVKEIPTKDLKLGLKPGGQPTQPETITSLEELKKSPVAGKAADDIKKHVDFAKEKLLVFCWAGSGQDVVAVSGETKDGKTKVKITYTPGKTRDLIPHSKLFVVPKDAEIVK